jgi:hypothetical protein
MNPKFEFLKYEPTPQEKHLGIATVKLYGKLIARYKIIPTKDGTSFFPASGSLKIGEKYESCLTLDSNSEKEELDSLIKAHVRSIQGGGQIVQPPPQQPQYQQMSFTSECPF